MCLEEEYFMFIDIKDLKTGQLHTVNTSQIVEFVRVANEFDICDHQIHLPNGTIINISKKQGNRIKNKILRN